MSKDTALIMSKILSNKNILKLLYYTTNDKDKMEDLNSTQIKSLISNRQISAIPQVKINKNKLSYLLITFDSFTPNYENEYYRDHIIEFKILCHFDDWDLENYELRPYRIAGELDAMFNKAHLTGIGELTFMGANQDIYNDEYGGVTLRYLAIRGNEDRVNPLA